MKEEEEVGLVVGQPIEMREMVEMKDIKEGDS